MKTTDLFRANIRSLTPYSTARDEFQGTIDIRLDANENPYNTALNRYPDPHQRGLKATIAKLKGIDDQNIFVGNGSDEAIDLMYRLFCEPRLDNAVSIAPTYGMYKVAARINDVGFREVQLDEGYRLDADKMLAATDSNTKLLFVCSPNNPTGNLLSRSEIDKLITSFGGIVVLDEAYIDFAADGGLLGSLERYPNLVILQTMSKAWGIAGLRVGFAFADKAIIGAMTKVKYPYNINSLTQQKAIEVAQRVERFQTKLRSILSERERLATLLCSIDKIECVYPSDSNFILVKTACADTIYRQLLENDIIVRNRNTTVGCEGCLRITVGTKRENNKLIDTLKRIKL